MEVELTALFFYFLEVSKVYLFCIYHSQSVIKYSRQLKEVVNKRSQNITTVKGAKYNPL